MSSIVDHYNSVLTCLANTIVEKNEKIKQLERTIAEKEVKIDGIEMKSDETQKFLSEKQVKIAQLYQDIIDLKS
jgi:hypothetical protein